ncbi:DUF624 domain-containing protein [Rhizobium sp. SSA_523]|uniref:DUF624 domain-containing protein n=1 Tax=Rhizobium sp. SSA_523 TaxID=2952477 RepID=UPI002090E210|nr:DUF624 domain-containing protein [Rhizobium sp. SSA_523]MCO5732333.1 DUF624 domain-containing protein [Rhizobium sp. SSA_523]WKC21265.1 DUF624 domain-containing protein [Rhizobium sp. SSA_523]
MQWLEALWTREGKGIAKDAPKKTGLALFFEIIGREWWELVKLNLLFLLASLPIVTLPAAAFATARICRSMAEDRNVYLLREFLEAMRDYALRSLQIGLSGALVLALCVYAVVSYGAAARDTLLYAAPLAMSLVATAFVAIMLPYAVMISVGRRLSIWQTVRLAALATLLRPLPMLAALLFVGGLWLAHIAFYPVSVFLPVTVNFSLGMFAVAFGARGAVAEVLATVRED